ncbi:MAG: pyridoxal phosphate-dependent aminotransferase [Candidatus Odinarchaeia archaeon]
MIRRISDIPISPVAIFDSIRKVECEKKVSVTRFDVAEPYFDPPASAIESTIKAIREGFRRYAPTKGLVELREKICEFLQQTRGINYSPEEIIVTPGAKFSIYSFFASVLEPNDEVILITPFWSSFKAVPIMLGCKKVKEVRARDPYMLDEERIKNAVNRNTKIVVINTPNNPTGGVLKKSDLELLSDLSEEYGFYILSDEVDWAYIYEDAKHISQASVGTAWERTLVVDSFSKVFCMTGWRIGFAAGPRELVDSMNIVQQHSVTGPPTFIQKACISVLEEAHQYVKKLVKQAAEKRKKILDGLHKIKKLKFHPPEGAFYIFPDAEAYGLESETLAEKMLKEAYVAVAPGTLFGKSEKYRFRICYALPEEQLNEGITRLVNFFETIE